MLKTPIPVSPKHGSCRECGSQLVVIDADRENETITVDCLNPQCDEVYDLEVDALPLHYATDALVAPQREPDNA